ncbi:MAG TPA: tyrosine--tRNA ligase [Caulobacterales bacterium]|nr:tyrosine--tRNA ligase [Caulobacterales bacterium]
MSSEFPAFASDFLRTMQARGYIHSISHPAELDAAARGRLIGYVGYDATAPSLHIGNLISIMMLRRLQQAGGKPIVVSGGGTTKVGDPTDKDQQRPLLSDAVINANIASQRQAFAKFLAFGDGPTDAIIVNNDEWLSKYGYVQFLRDFGAHFSVNRMLAFDSVKLRLEREQPMSFLEFNYMLMQAVDFLELFRRHGCTLQMGGSDQWGNILNGVELIRRVEQKPAFGLTTPLLLTSSGEKMGKTVGGAVWLNADMLSPYEYWQMWRNTEDGDVARFLKLFTDLPLDEIARIEALQGAEINDGKILLANLATAMLHGADSARQAEAAARGAFTGGDLSGLPSIDVPSTEFAAGLRLANALTRAGLTASNGEAKRLIEQSAIAVNDSVVSDAGYTLSPADLRDGAIKLTRGKTRHALVRILE